MTTSLWTVDPSSSNLQAQLKEASQLLRDGEVVAFPTETVYGLGGDACSDSAINKIFQGKGRPSDNPLIVHVHSLSQLPHLLSCKDLPPLAARLAAAFWPGPLTIILPVSEHVSKRVTCGLTTVGIRMPNHPVALALLREAGIPLAAPSANLSGRPSPTAAHHVVADLDGRIAGVVDGGDAGVGVESTVVQCSEDGLSVLILRPGGVTYERLEAVVGKGHVGLDPGLEAALRDRLQPKLDVSGAAALAPAVVEPTDISTSEEPSKDSSRDDNNTHGPRAPGMKYAHYAPHAPLHLVDGSESFFLDQVLQAQRQGKRVGVLVCREHANRWRARRRKEASLDTQGEDNADTVLVTHLEVCGSRKRLDSVATALFACLRGFDSLRAPHDVDIIFAEKFPDKGLGAAVMNRLAKAAVATRVEGDDTPDDPPPAAKQRKLAG